MGPNLAAEICVIGGGPAGATVARRLALLGHDVCLLESAAFPRRHIGESLPPGIVPLFDFLGLRERIEAASFLRPSQAIVRWGGVTREFDFAPGAPGFQVDRGRFDQLLLEAAQEAGVRVLQPARALRPRLGAGQIWQVPALAAHKPLQIQAAYLVDASGRHPVLAGAKTRAGAPTLALYAYWRSTGLTGAATRVEAGAKEWFWGAPLPDATFNATVFIAPARCRAVRGAAGRAALYRSLLASSALLRGCLNGTLASRMLACDASTYTAACPVDNHSIKVGEASLAIDPLSSQGVQAAITSALHGSIVVHTLLTRPEHAPAALQFYRDRQLATAAYHSRLAAQHYAQQSALVAEQFWQTRAAGAGEPPPLDQPTSFNALLDAGLTGSSRIKLSEQLRIKQLPCISGNVIRALPTLTHPALERPVAFVTGVELAALLGAFADDDTVSGILRSWAPLIAPQRGLQIINWMYSAGVIVQVYERAACS